MDFSALSESDKQAVFSALPFVQGCGLTSPPWSQVLQAEGQSESLTSSPWVPPRPGMPITMSDISRRKNFEASSSSSLPLPPPRAITKNSRKKSTCGDNSGRALNWVFTLNNYHDDDCELLDKLVQFGVATYVVYGFETAPVTGTPHLQGMVTFTKRRRLSQILDVCPTAHYEVMRGTPEQASQYCKKGGLVREFGSMPLSAAGRAKRDYAAIVASCKAGDLESLDPQIFFLHYGVAKRIKSDFAKAPANLDDVCGVWFMGPPGSGKSFMARTQCAPEDLYLKPCNKWWDSYQGQSHVLLDDFDTNHKCLGHHLKIWADRYAFAAEQKGSTVQIRPKKLIITSNYSVAEIFGDDLALTTAIKRRFQIYQVVDRQAVLLDD